MRSIKTPQILTAYGSCPEDFDADLNAKVQRLVKSGLSVNLQLNTSQGLCAHILYDITTEVPETVRDEFILNGESYRCSECPMFARPRDGRKKYTACRYRDYGVKADNEACEVFYKRVLRGEWEPKGGRK